MLWADRWRQLSLWNERTPLWFQVTVFPVVAPAVMGVAAACLCPRTAAVSVGLLALFYGVAIGGGLMDWARIGRTLGILYLGFVVHTYLGVLEHLWNKLYTRWCGTPETPGEPDESRKEGEVV